jgi:hypothetical protein
METTERTLSGPVLAALRFWPGHSVDPDPVDLTVLRSFLDELFDRRPWWDRAWRVVEVRPGYPAARESDAARSSSPFSEVHLPGTIGRDTGETLPLSATVRFAGNRLLRFTAKVGDTVIGPAASPPGEPEPLPIGAVISTLMISRDVSIGELARRTGRAMSTINGAISGRRHPGRQLLVEIAAALDIPEADMLAIANLEFPTSKVRR